VCEKKYVGHVIIARSGKLSRKKGENEIPKRLIIFSEKRGLDNKEKGQKR